MSQDVPEQQNKSSEDENRFHRMVARMLVRKRVRQAAPYPGVGDLKKAVRREKIIVESQPIIPSLTKDIVFLNENLVPFLNDLVVELRKKSFVPGLSVIVSGSNVHGGADIRKIANTADSPDFDYALGADNLAPLIRARVRINEYIKDFIEHEKSAYNLPPAFEPCKLFSGLEMVNNFFEVEEAKKWLLSSLVEGGLDNAVLYFYPSIPSETNEQNRRLVLEALALIHGEDEQKWSRLKKALIAEWQEHHRIKGKHFGGTDSASEWHLIEHIESKVPELMIKPFAELIESTAL